MNDQEFLITYDGYTVSTGVGMGDSGGYPVRKVCNVDNIGEYWFWLRDDPAIRENIRFYKLVEIDRSECFNEMECRKREDAEEERINALKRAEAEVKRLKEG